MKNILTLIFTTVVTCIVVNINLAQAQNIDDRTRVCMMQDSLQVKPGTPIEIDGKTYYGCCSMCAGKMKANPAKYTKAKDPVSSALVDKSGAFVFAHNGSIYYFESEDTRKKFAEHPSEYLK